MGLLSVHSVLWIWVGGSIQDAYEKGPELFCCHAPVGSKLLCQNGGCLGLILQQIDTAFKLLCFGEMVKRTSHS